MRLFFHFILVIVSLYMYGNAPKSIDEKYMALIPQHYNLTLFISS